MRKFIAAAAVVLAGLAVTSVTATSSAAGHGVKSTAGHGVVGR